MQVEITRKSGRKSFLVSSRYKQLVMSTRYNKSPYTARTLLRGLSLRKTTVQELCRVICREIHQLSSIKYGASILRDSSPSTVTIAKPIVAELKSNAPVLYTVIKAAIGSPAKIAKPSQIGIAAYFYLGENNNA